MLTFKRLENAYGIKELKNIESLNTSNNILIYASNGCMKTSFSDAIKDIINERIPKDVFTEEQCVFNIEHDKISINEQSLKKIDNVIVFSNPTIEDIFENNDLCSLALSDKLKEDYKSIVDMINLNNISLKNLLKKVEGTEKISEKSIPNLLDYSNSTSIIEALEKVIDDTSQEYTLFNDVSFNRICNNKINNLISINNLEDEIKIYKDIVDKNINTSVFNNGFTYDGLSKVYQINIDTKYFAAGHKLFITNNFYGEEETKKLLDDMLTDIYEFESVKQQFDKISKIITKNKESNDFYDLIKSKPQLLTLSSSFKDTQLKYYQFKLFGYKDEIQNIINEFKRIEVKISQFNISVNEEKTTWSEIINTFNNRFIVPNFHVTIEYIFENKLFVPRIRFLQSKKGCELTKSQIKRFSKGEQRAIIILLLMFKIEKLKENYNDVTIILDDIADSFDYKNKYGILKYLIDLSTVLDEDGNITSNPKIQLIIFTHNFDFFRCLSLKLNKNIKKYNAVKKEKFVILHEAKADHLFDISFVYKWFKEICGNEKKINEVDFVALLPFVRSIVQMIEGTKSQLYNELNNYLHYKKDNSNKNIELKKLFIDEDKNIFKYFGCFHDINEKFLNNTYDNILACAAKQLVNKRSIRETDIKCKMAISILIRIEYEKFIFSKDKRRNNISDESLIKNYIAIKGKLSDDQEAIKNVEYALTIIDPYLHANSFMYEQLIDNSIDKMQEVLKFFVKQNS